MAHGTDRVVAWIQLALLYASTPATVHPRPMWERLTSHVNSMGNIATCGFKMEGSVFLCVIQGGTKYPLGRAQTFLCILTINVVNCTDIATASGESVNVAREKAAHIALIREFNFVEEELASQ